MTLDEEWENASDDLPEIGDEVLCDCGEIKAGKLIDVTKHHDLYNRDPPYYMFHVEFEDGSQQAFDEDAPIVKRHKNA